MKLYKLLKKFDNFNTFYYDHKVGFKRLGTRFFLIQFFLLKVKNEILNLNKNFHSFFSLKNFLFFMNCPLDYPIKLRHFSLIWMDSRPL